MENTPLILLVPTIAFLRMLSLSSAWLCDGNNMTESLTLPRTLVQSGLAHRQACSPAGERQAGAPAIDVFVRLRWVRWENNTKTFKH